MTVIEQIHDGTEFDIIARYWPGGLHLRAVADPEPGVGPFHPQATKNLSEPVTYVECVDLDGREPEDVHLLFDEGKVNVSFGRTAAENGAFNPVYQQAVEL